MKKILVIITLASSFSAFAQLDTLRPVPTISREEINKEIARNFYEDLWFNNRTENYNKYLADEYVAHDIGKRKNMTEPAIEQKIVADRFWNSGEMSGKIDYQIAEGDLVATRWSWSFESNSLIGKFFEGENLPIINVFRFNDEGKIVELWNHRHDIDTNQTLMYTIKGLLIGLLIALIPTIIAFRLKRKIKQLKTT